MSNPIDKKPIYPNTENFWSYSNSGYYNSLVAHNLAIIAEVTQSQQELNAQLQTKIKQINDSLRGIQKTLDDLNKRRVVVQRD